MGTLGHARWCTYRVRILYVSCTYGVRILYVLCTYRVPLAGIGHYLPLASGGLCPGRGNAGWRGKGKECFTRLVARLSFFDGQGEQVTVRCEIEDDVAVVGFDGVEQGRFVEPITGHDIGLRLDQ